ncbi:hypothetical protein B0T26DRAFT_775970, partial [Lasiosphaeria miniovina]
WATCYTNEKLNFGTRTTSLAEVVNRYLKSFITGNSTILDAVKQSLKIIEEMRKGIQENHNEQKYNLKRKYLGQKWLGDTPLEISRNGMKKVTEQYRVMLGAVPTFWNPTPEPLSPCTGQFKAHYGIPCSHNLERYMDGRVRLEPGQEGNLVLKKLWIWLERSMLSKDRYLRYNEFNRIERLRGRPRGSDALALDPRAPRSTAPISTALSRQAPRQPLRHPPHPLLQRPHRLAGLRASILPFTVNTQWEGVRLEQEDNRDQENPRDDTPAQAQRTVNNLTGRGSRDRKAHRTRATKGGPGSRGGRVASGSRASTSLASSGTPASTPTALRARGGITKASTRGATTRRTTRALAAAFEAKQSSDLDDA